LEDQSGVALPTKLNPLSFHPMTGLANERNFQMAKSIYDLLQDLETETSVPEVLGKDGKAIRGHFGMVPHTFPRSALPTSEQFEDEDALLEWAKETGNLHACLQSGVQARVIDLRAIFKSYKKDEEWSPSYGQSNVDTSEWKVVTRPQGKKDPKTVITDFLSKMSKKERQAWLKENDLI